VRYKRYIKIALILIFIVFIFILADIVVTLLVHDYDNIGYYSIFKYLVDKEVRDLPIIKEGSNISYRSAASDGKPFVVSGVTLNVDSGEKYYRRSIEYFIGLGYTQTDDCSLTKSIKNYCYLVRNDYEIIVDQKRNTIKVTKYTPVEDT